MVLSPQLVGRVPKSDQPRLLSWSNPMWWSNGIPHVAVRSDPELRAFALDFDHGELRAVGVFPAPWGRWKTAPDAVAPDLSFAVFSGQNAVQALDQRGKVLWEYEHDCWGCGDLESGSVIITADGRRVWATAPSPHVDKWGYDGDEWLVFEAATGAVLGRTTLDCAAAGSFHLLHPDGIHVGLSVGEGQDGTPGYWGHLEQDSLNVRMVGERDRDRVLIDAAPDGRSYLTIAHGQGDVAIHSFSDDTIVAGTEATTLLERSGLHVDDAGFDYEAGYLTPDRVIVATTYETENTEDHQHWVVDAHTAEPLGKILYPTTAGVVRTLGDGTWLTADAHNLWRWALP